MTCKEKGKPIHEAQKKFHSQTADKTARCKGCIWRNQNCDSAACLFPRCISPKFKSAK